MSKYINTLIKLREMGSNNFCKLHTKSGLSTKLTMPCTVNPIGGISCIDCVYFDESTQTVEYLKKITGDIENECSNTSGKSN